MFLDEGCFFMEGDWSKNLEKDFQWRDGDGARCPETLPFFFDCRKVILTVRRDAETRADNPHLPFTNPAGVEVHRVPYMSEQSSSELLSLLALKAGVPTCQVALILLPRFQPVGGGSARFSNKGSAVRKGRHADCGRGFAAGVRVCGVGC